MSFRNLPPEPPLCRSKKRVIEGWVSKHLGTLALNDISFYKKKPNYSHYIKATISIEEPERQATITESELEKALDGCGFLPSNKHRDALKDKLFRGEK